MSYSSNTGPVVVTVRVGSASKPGPTTTTTTTTTTSQDPPAHHGNLPLTGAPLVMEVTAALALMAAGTMAALAARRQRRVRG